MKPVTDSEVHREAREAYRWTRWSWAETGWSRLEEALERWQGLATLAMVGMLAITVLLAYGAVQDLPTIGVYLLILPALLGGFIVSGWALMPWLTSTDRRRASMPAGVLLVGVAIWCAGGWWMIPGGAVLVVSALLGIREVQLTGQDVELARMLEEE